MKYQTGFKALYKKYFRHKLWLVILLITVLTVGIAANSITPYLFGKMIDMIGEKDLNNLLNYMKTYFFILVGAIFLGWIEGYLGELISTTVSNNIKASVFKKILTMQYIDLQKYSSGQLMSRLESDAEGIVKFYLDAATSIIVIVFNLAVSIYFVFSISIPLTTFSIILLPLTIIINIVFRNSIKALEKSKKDFNDRYMGSINEALLRSCLVSLKQHGYERKCNHLMSIM